MALRQQLRNLCLSLCALQLAVTCMGLGVAYQIRQSYWQNIQYENSVADARQDITQLQTLARAVMPESMLLDDSSGSSQFSQIRYASGIFLSNAHNLLNGVELNPSSPLAQSSNELKSLITDMETVRDQNKLADDSWSHHDALLLRARLTYIERAAARLDMTLGNVLQDMSRAKEQVLADESEQANRAEHFLKPLSILCFLLVIPALLYVRHLDKHIREYEMRLEDEKIMLEARVASRTSELQNEIHKRNRVEEFNDSRNRLLEKVVEGRDLEEVLNQLTRVTEQSVPEGRCVILLGTSKSGVEIAPSSTSGSVVRFGSVQIQNWDALSAAVTKEQGAIFVTDMTSDARTEFSDVWSQGFQNLYALSITEPEQPSLGVIVLLLPDDREPIEFVRELLLSASRMAAITLKHERMNHQLLRRAQHDALTELPNRILFEDRLQQAMARAGRRKRGLGILCIDLDDFKQVNDQYGHQCGDWLLQQVAQRLTQCLRKTDTLARIGGDEFVAVLDDQDENGLMKVCELWIKLLAEPFTLGDLTLHTSASVGAALYPADGNTSEELKRHADVAMYRAKERGRNTFQMFSADLSERLERRRQIEAHLQTALLEDGFELHYQPIYDLSRKLVGLEALIRFARPEWKTLSPCEFIPVAEQTGQIIAIGEWVLREACRQAKQWMDEGFEPIPVALNVSTLQLARSEFAGCLAQILLETGLPPKYLHIEITETAMMSDVEEGGRQLYALEELGVPISVDDFGTGHSSLSYIHRLPIHRLKIDRSFVQQIVNCKETQAIVRAIVAMARALELTVVAEGVETVEQLTAVANVGCDFVQGYFFDKPLDKIAVRALFRALPSTDDVETSSELNKANRSTSVILR